MSRSTVLRRALTGWIAWLLMAVPLSSQPVREKASLARGEVELETKNGRIVSASQVKVQLVDAAGARGTVVAETYTDPQGVYYFEEVPAGEYRLEVLASRELAPISFPVRISSGELVDLSKVLVRYSARIILRRYENSNISPGTILEHPTTGAILVLSHPTSHVYLLDRENGTLRDLGGLWLNGRAADHCLVTVGTETWIVSLSRSTSGSGVPLTYVTVTPLLEEGRGLGESRVRRLYFRSFSTILCRSRTRQIVLMDREQAGIYEVPFLAHGELGSLEPLPLPSGLSFPTSIAFAKNGIFAGDQKKRRVLHVVDGEDVVELPGEIQSPVALTTSVRKEEVAAIDTFEEKVMQWTREEGRWERRELALPRDLRNPTAILFTRDGSLLVSGAGGLIVEFLPAP